MWYFEITVLENRKTYYLDREGNFCNSKKLMTFDEAMRLHAIYFYNPSYDIKVVEN